MALLLVVDDEELLRRSVRRMLQAAGHEVLEAATVTEATEMISAREVELVLCDIHMPGGSGLELVRSVAGTRPQTAVIMLSGIDDPAVAEQALDIGAYGYLVKPAERNEIVITVASGLRRRELELAQNDYVRELEDKLLSRSAALRDALDRVEKSETHARASEREIVDRLVTALSLRSEETGAHIRRVGAYSAMLAAATGDDAARPEEIRLAAMLHDIGKIGVPDTILLKPGALTTDEFEAMKRHTVLGAEMLADGQSPVIKLGAEIALTHHERWDGTGYPGGLQRDETPLPGRITAVADVFDALTSDRVYREAWPIERAVDQMTQERDRHFDPDLLDLFAASVEQVDAIREAYPDHIHSLATD
jgi:putative two-component system response regulator